jgi:hypothetical protein
MESKMIIANQDEIITYSRPLQNLPMHITYREAPMMSSFAGQYDRQAEISIGLSNTLADDRGAWKANHIASFAPLDRENRAILLKTAQDFLETMQRKLKTHGIEYKSHERPYREYDLGVERNICFDSKKVSDFFAAVSTAYDEAVKEMANRLKEAEKAVERSKEASLAKS